MRTIGIVSDTHGILREEALEALRGSDLIIHAGDIGSLEVLERLRAIAPVRAVRGNTDYGEVAAALPNTDVVDLSAPDGSLSQEGRGPVAYVLHGHLGLDLDPEASGFRVVVSGHTHEPLIREQAGVLYFNPGSAGPRRFTLPVTVGRLLVDGESVEAEIIDLEGA